MILSYTNPDVCVAVCVCRIVCVGVLLCWCVCIEDSAVCLCTVHGSQMAERLGNHASNQKVACLIPGCEN